MSPDANRLPIVAIVGATASGKTGLSLDLATELGGEIVNTDAMQLYRGMDVGTAKLPPAERVMIQSMNPPPLSSRASLRIQP